MDSVHSLQQSLQIPSWFFLSIVVLHFFYGYFQFILAKKCNILHPWMAFIPFLNVYQLVIIGGWDKKGTLFFFIPGINFFVILFFMYCFAKRFGEKNPWIFMVAWPVLFIRLSLQYNPAKKPLNDSKLELLETLLNTPQSKFPDANKILLEKQKKEEEEAKEEAQKQQSELPQGPAVLKYNIPKPILRNPTIVETPEESPKQASAPVQEEVKPSIIPPKSGGFSVPKRMTKTDINSDDSSSN